MWEEPWAWSQEAQLCHYKAADFMESQSCFCSYKLGTVNCTSQSCHEDEIGRYIKVLNTEPGT